jgi:carboxylesterase type B
MLFKLFSGKILSALGCDFKLTDTESALRCLHQKSSDEIVNSQSKTIEAPTIYPFVPTVDGKFVQNHPNNLLSSGQFQNIPVLIGSTENEGHL